MSIHTLYRVCIWLPILVPAAFIAFVNAVGARLASEVGVVGELLAYSLIYGGVPYAALAIWATKWVGGKTEVEIRRLMFRAPLLMVAIFIPLALVMGVIVGAPVQFAAVALLGAVVIVLLGYGYVALTVALREGLGPRLHRAPGAG